MSPRPPALLRALLATAALVIPTAIAGALSDLPPPIRVLVDGEPALVEQGATLGRAIASLDLRPHPGRLLDVHGEVLDPHADPGRVLLNGVAEPRLTPLAEGDRIQVIDGTDRTEGTRTRAVLLPGRRLADPMYTLATSRVRRITTVGRVSGEVASVRYRAVGGAHRPPEVALTFDDGPWPGSTRRILGVLERMHVRATFFMVGYLVQRYPGIVRAVQDAGMAIGDHSWSHPYRTPFRELSPHRIWTEIARPARLLRARFGIQVGLFRTPGGAFDQHVVDVARREGMRVVQWSVDPRDYRPGTTPGRIARSVLAGVRPGAIVLLHDGGGDRRATLLALPRIIRGIRRMGLRPVALPATPLSG